jgi:hypothetical protein
MKKLLSAIVLTLILSACNSGVNSSPENNSNGQSTQEASSLALSYVTTVPTLSGSDSSFSMLLINDSNHALSPVLSIGDSSQDKHGISINSTKCQNVAAHSTCRLDLHLTNQYQNGYFEISATANAAGEILKTQQLISYSNRDNENEQIFYSNFDAPIMSGNGQKFSVAVPVRSKQTYLKDAQVGINDAGSDKNNLNSALHCANNNECTAMVSGQLTTTDNFDLSLNSNYFSGVNVPIGVTKGDIGNLLISGESNIQSPADGTVYTRFTILNNGHKPVSNIALSYIQSNTETGTISNGTCTNYIGSNNSLAAGSSCTFTINIKSFLPSNSVSNIQASYNDGTNNRTVSTKLGFIPTAHTNPAIAINAPNLGTMVDTMVGESRTATVTLSTLNNYPLSNIVISNSSQLRANIFTITRNTCSTIQNGSNCSFDITYTPTQAEAGNLIMLVKAEYTDQQNHKISQVSNSLSFNYNSNELKAFLTNSTANNGFNLCDVSTDGKSFNCSVTGNTITEINSTTVKNSISTFKDTRGYLHAYVSRNPPSGQTTGIVYCNLKADGTFDSCPATGAGVAQTYNRTTTVNGNNYLIMSNTSAGTALMTKALLNPLDGTWNSSVTGPSWENTSASTAQVPNNSSNQQIAVFGNNVYMAQMNSAVDKYDLVWCKLSSNGLWDTTNSNGNCSMVTEVPTTNTVVNGVKPGFDNLRGVEVVTINNKNYLYIVRADTNTTVPNNSFSIGSVTLSPTGSIESGSFTLQLGSNSALNPKTLTTSDKLQGARFIRNININGTNYLYYSDNNTVSASNTSLRRVKINSDGTLGTPENITITAKSGANIYSQISGIVPFWSNTSAMLSYSVAPANNTHTPGKTESITLTFSDGSAPNTNITLTPPAGVTVTPTTFTLNSTTRSKVISVTTAANTTGTYTITGTSDSGVIVPSYTFSMLAAPTITGFTPTSGTGIGSDYLSTNLTLVNSSGNRMASISFSRALDSSKLIPSNIKLQSSSNNTDFSDFTGSYSWTISGNTISLALDTNLTSGNYYRIILNQDNVTDQYGNKISGGNTAYEVTRFRAALKVFVTLTAYPGNFGGLSGADYRCNLAGEAGTPADGSYYKAIIGAAPHTHNTSTFKNDTRAPLQPGWVMLGNTNYYQINAQTLIATSTSDGKLPITLAVAINPTGPNEAWTGFDQNWSVIDGLTSNYACNNWTDNLAGSARTGFSNASAIGAINSATKGYLTNSDSPACNTSKRLYCVQQP